MSTTERHGSRRKSKSKHNAQLLPQSKSQSDFDSSLREEPDTFLLEEGGPLAVEGVNPPAVVGGAERSSAGKRQVEGSRK